MKKEKLVVKEHCLDTRTKKWTEWTTCSNGNKMPKRPSERNLELPELFTPDHTTKYALNATMMKDTKLATRRVRSLVLWQGSRYRTPNDKSQGRS